MPKLIYWLRAFHLPKIGSPDREEAIFWRSRYSKHIHKNGFFHRNSEHFLIGHISLISADSIDQTKHVGGLKSIYIFRWFRICYQIFSTSIFTETAAPQRKSCHQITNHFFISGEERHLLPYWWFLDASTHLYTRVCLSVCWSVGPSIRWSVGLSVHRSVRWLIRWLVWWSVRP